MSKKILIKFPTRNRPQKFKETFLKYNFMKSGNHEVNFLISMDIDDDSMNNENVRKFLNSYSNVKYYYGNSKTKIEAINADLDKIEGFDIMLLASDDMIPQKVNYDSYICDLFDKHFPDYDGVIHQNDGRQGQRLNTFCILGKKYFDRFGYIYHPSYKSVFCDNEFMIVSQKLNKVIYTPEILFYHGWTNYVGYDALMQRNENRENYIVDEKNYMERLNRNFDL